MGAFFIAYHRPHLDRGQRALSWVQNNAHDTRRIATYNHLRMWSNPTESECGALRAINEMTNGQTDTDEPDDKRIYRERLQTKRRNLRDRTDELRTNIRNRDETNFVRAVIGQYYVALMVAIASFQYIGEIFIEKALDLLATAIALFIVYVVIRGMVMPFVAAFEAGFEYAYDRADLEDRVFIAGVALTTIVALYLLYRVFEWGLEPYTEQERRKSEQRSLDGYIGDGSGEPTDDDTASDSDTDTDTEQQSTTTRPRDEKGRFVSTGSAD